MHGRREKPLSIIILEQAVNLYEEILQTPNSIKSFCNNQNLQAGIVAF